MKLSLGRFLPKLGMVAVVAMFVLPRATHRPDVPSDPKARIERLVWLNNWIEARDRVEQLRVAEPTDDWRVLVDAIRIRGSLEQTPLPEAATRISELLGGSAQLPPALRLQLLAIQGDIEFHYDLARAEATWAVAREQAHQLGDAAWTARVNGELGTIAFLKGEPIRALSLVARSYFAAEWNGDVAAQIRYRTALGEGLAEFGRTSDAIRFFEKALDLAAVTPGAYFPFTAHLGKARLLVLKGEPDAGYRMLREALTESRSKGLAIREARTSAVLAELAEREGRRKEAAEWLLSTVRVARNQGLRRIESAATSRLAANLQALGEARKATELAQIGIEAAEASGDRYHLPQRLAVLAETAARANDLETANRAYERAASVVDGLIAEVSDARDKNLLVSTMESVFRGHFDLALNRELDLEKAFQIIESARGRGDADLLTRAHGQDGLAQPTGSPQRLRELHQRLFTEQDVLSRQGLLDRLWEAELRSQRLRDSADLAVAKQARPVTLSAVRSKLGDGEALIEYVLGEPTSTALVITQRAAAHYPLRSRPDIEAAAQRYGRVIASRQDARHAGRDLYRLLLEPIPAVRHARRLVIVPDGVLHQVPFEAFVESSGNYVVNTHIVSYVPSATVLYRLMERRSIVSQGRTGEVPVLVVGGARYKQTPRVSLSRGNLLFGPQSPALWGPLPNSTKEVRDVAMIGGPSTTMLLGEMANEEAVKALPWERYRILHFAVHAAADPEFPARSALILLPGSAGREDGLLQGREVAARRLRADLVTLSACDAGVGELSGIAGINNLVQAFLVAGSRAVIGSAWEADDAFTATLMRELYSELARGADAAEALTIAKRRMLVIFGPSPSPAYWAGFRLVGDGSGRILRGT